MKLLVIVLCLISERYLVHAFSLTRFDWYAAYWNRINKLLPEHALFANRYVAAICAIAPLVFLAGLLLALFCNMLFGFIYLTLNIAIFYYCIGPVNPFYPIDAGENGAVTEEGAKTYFAAVNRQVFAVIFWYIVLGPLAILLYRLIDMTMQQKGMTKLLAPVMNVLDWIPARITVVLYLLVGNFQHGLAFFLSRFIATPDKNTRYLSECGLLAAGDGKKEDVSLPIAQTMVEHALIVYLVFLAFFTLVSWL